MPRLPQEHLPSGRRQPCSGRCPGREGYRGVGAVPFTSEVGFPKGQLRATQEVRSCIDGTEREGYPGGLSSERSGPCPPFAIRRVLADIWDGSGKRISDISGAANLSKE